MAKKSSRVETAKSQQADKLAKALESISCRVSNLTDRLESLEDPQSEARHEGIKSLEIGLNKLATHLHDEGHYAAAAKTLEFLDLMFREGHVPEQHGWLRLLEVIG